MHKYSKVWAALPALVWAFASAGVPADAVADDVAFYKVIVRTDELVQRNSGAENTQKDRLTRFVERLRAELKVDNLGDANIGCDRCGELVDAEHVDYLDVPNRQLSSLEFTLNRDGSLLEAFARSYQFVQAGELESQGFTMEVSGKNPGAAACPTQAAEWGCRTRAVCSQTSGCDKPYGGACNVCKQ